jgi:hypothetical protein
VVYGDNPGMSAGRSTSNDNLLPVQAYFATTHWSVVLNVGRSTSPEAAMALEQLCRTYWYPLYSSIP